MSENQQTFRLHKLKSPIESAVAHSTNSSKNEKGISSESFSIVDVRRRIEGHSGISSGSNNKKSQRNKSYDTSSPDFLAEGSSTAKKSRQQQSEANTAHRIDFMRKLEEGRVGLESGNSNQQSCVFQQLDIEKELLEVFAQMNFNPADFGNASIGKRNANTRRIVIPLTNNGNGASSIPSMIGTNGLNAADPTVRKNISVEYAARYCELLNIAPTAKNLSMIQKMIPLSSCTVTNMYNAGQARNNIVIEPSRLDIKIREKDSVDDIVYQLLSSESSTDDAALGCSSSSVNEKEKKKNDTRESGKNPSASKTIASKTNIHPPPIPTNNAAFMRINKNNTNLTNIQELSKFPVFDEYKYRFVFPWNVDEKDVSGDKTMGVERIRTFIPSELHNSQASSSPLANPNSTTDNEQPQQNTHDEIYFDDKKDNEVERKLKVLDQLVAKVGKVPEHEVLAINSLISNCESKWIPSGANNDRPIHPPASIESSKSNFTTSSQPEHVPLLFRFSPQDAINTAIHNELSTPMIPSDASEIQSLLRQFVNGFPWQRLLDRVSPNHIAAIQKYIRSSSQMITICLQLSHLMFSSYVRPFSNSVPSLTPMQIEDLFLDIAAGLTLHIRTQDSIEHALRLLGIRVVILAELTSRLPLFSSCDIGESVKKGIDTIITGVGDPTGLICRISVFESSPQALRMIRQKRLPKVNVLGVRSPISELLLERPSGLNALNAPPPPNSEFSIIIEELRKFVTPRIRQQLLSILRQSSF